MAYDPSKDKTAGYISIEHETMLQTLKTAHKRTKRGELEWLIEQEFHKLNTPTS